MLDVAATVMLLLLHFHSCVTHVAAGTMLHVAVLLCYCCYCFVLVSFAVAGAMLLTS